MDKDYINNLKKFAKNLTILYVEDNKEARDSTLELLKIFFNNIIIAHNGIEGLNKFNNNIDLVITDINMPKMNGLDMIQKIKEINKNIPILIISAHNETQYLMSSIKSDVYDYILKPIQTVEFINIISKILDNIKLNVENIKYKTKLEDKIEKQDKIIIHQAKLAAMGEMIDSIAHQWKQPLGVISLNIQSTQLLNSRNQTISIEEFNNCAEKVQLQINHLVSTMDEFRTFFRPNIVIKEVIIKNTIDSVFLLLKDTLIQEKIDIDISGDITSKIYLIENEFKHIIINIINNAKDAFKNQTSKKININVENLNHTINIHISDNAGGIPENIIEHIFESNFTTKEVGKGTGIGLYMSKTIIEKINGKLSVKNNNDGAVFKIEIPKINTEN